MSAATQTMTISTVNAASPYSGTMLDTGILTGGLTVSSSFRWNSISVTPPRLGENEAGDIVLRTKRSVKLCTEDGREIDLLALASAMMELLERAAVLLPDLERHEHYPALKQAFDHYRVLHGLVRDDPTPEG